MRITYSEIIIFSIVALFFYSPITFSQTKKPVKDITQAMDSGYLLPKEKKGINKQIPMVFEKQVLYALSYFPELAQIRITFKIKKSKGGIISTRPTVGSIFRRSSNREYVVVINDSTEGRTFPLFSNSGVNGQVGILGHELCHVIYFNNKSGFGLIGLAIGHVSRKYMDNFENKTDSMDIERGLGYQLIDWNLYLEKSFSAFQVPGTPDPFEKTGTRERYMSIEHINRVMAKSAIYQ